MASSAVNRPTDVKVKEQDVNNKLQLYGIYAAFANGKVPSNKQIDVTLNSLLASKALSTPSKKLSPEGQNLVADLRDVIEKAKLLVLTKNEGNLLQDFIWQTTQISGGNAKAPTAPVDKATAKEHGDQALEGLRTLGTLLISNGQFRKLLSDSVILLRDIAGDAATNVASRVNPDEATLAQIDHPADDNTWHDVPDMSSTNIKSQVKAQYDKNKPFSKADVQGALNDSNNNATAVDGTTGEKAQTGLGAAVTNLKGKANENVPEDTKERARYYREKTNNYFQGKMPKERREQTIWRLKKMIVEIQGHQDYMRAVETLLQLAETYTGHSKEVATQGTGAVKGAHTDTGLKAAEADLKTLIERFANSTSLDDLFDSINTIYRDADKDPDLKQFFKDLDLFVRKCLKEQGFILQEESNAEWNTIYDKGRYLLRDRYRGHTDRVVDEIKFFGKQFDSDAQNKAFGASMQKLFQNLGNDESGNPKFKPYLLKDISEVILPAAFEHIRYVPIPRIEYTDPQIDAIVENLVIESDNLAPNVLEFGSDNYWRWGRKSVSNKNKNKIMLAVSGVQMDLRDVSYYVKRKQGTPKITDKGVADIFLGGQGLSFKVEMETADKSDRAHFFKINKVHVDVKHMNIKLKKSNHKLLFSLVKPLLFRMIRPVLQVVLQKQIKENVAQLDALAWSVKQEVDKAVEDAKRNPDPENVENIYQRYVNAIKKQVLEGKEKTEQVVEDKKVNVAVTQHDSIFKDISLPGGISSKATEFKDLAAKGDKWESPVFGLGSAKESTSLPKVDPITRKSHTTTSSTTAGGATSNTFTSNTYTSSTVNGTVT